MKLSVSLTIVLGLAVATLIAGYFGFAAVLQAVSRIGWRGLGALSLYTALPFCLLGGAWYVVSPPATSARLSGHILARVVRDSAGELLPFSHVGGFVFGARAAVLAGLSSAQAFSTTVVDVTTELIAQLGFIGLGLGLLIARLGPAKAQGGLVGSVALGLALTTAAAAAFIALQRRGAGLAEKLAGRFAPEAATRTGDLGRALNALYDRPGRIAAAVGLHLAAWVTSAIGAWLALKVGGVPIRLDAIIAVESLVGAARTAGFFAPMGIGVQEAAYVLIGPVFGLGPELALALSLVKRARDLVIGAPALLIWQFVEGRRVMSRGSLSGSGRDGG